MSPPTGVVICGAAGRDFHDFNMLYRDNPAFRVVAFTATQIPGIDSRRYPPVLAGSLYPDGIPIVAESELEQLLRTYDVEEVVFAYSDVDYQQLMDIGNRALAGGARFLLPSPKATMIRSKVPVIAVCAVRTGCGKSQVSRFLSAELAHRGLHAAAIRHPMPYGELDTQIVQRFASCADIDAAHCTLEEREEYEPHIAAGGVVYAGVDYQEITRRAEQEADVIIWDGGNNDFAFLQPDFTIVVVDALRPQQLNTHYPGAAVLKTADLVIVNKIHAASSAQRDEILRNLDTLLPSIPRIEASSPVTVDDPDALRGRRVLVIEDGPTITHGGMPHGAGLHAAMALNAEIVDPRQNALPEIAEVFARYPHIGQVLPALGYDPEALTLLQQTINAANVDAVVAGTPIDLARVIAVNKPVVRARYAYQDAVEPGLMSHIDAFLERL